MDRPGDLDRMLHDLAAAMAGPTLVELRAGGAVLTIGIGQPHASVALYLDGNRQPFSSRGTVVDLQPDDLRFEKDGGTYEFHPHAAVTPSEARAAAVEFATTGGRLPTSLTWVLEGPGDTS